ncbi:helix-turn-helix domain-containing protein [Chitinophaga pendula]|uniref:helix-turn-helix domain-containing protein n=1 Tax=Chitinophaga TaxID=79328 RepID=UPI000BAF345B|nr:MULTISPECIES: helix-turn-helix domain-containing protein [Chitinophaga]ASZ11012.1 AraC family transcriptional regulator [Chitinophaga sp. MD30]UCJ05997.1 helix-turn-helix domain-containing protein [Chitinophaga pendula]
MRTVALSVCGIGMFGEGIRHFWMSDLKGLLEEYPALEYPHAQDFYTLLLIEKASGEMMIDEVRVRLDEAKAIIIKPGSISSIDINRQAAGKIICFTDDFFSLRYNNNVLHQFSFLKNGMAPYVRYNDAQQRRAGLVSGLMHEEYQQSKKEAFKVLRSYLNILLFEMERLYHPGGWKQEAGIKAEKVVHFEKLVDEHFMTQKMPSAYADMLCVSPNYLNKLCKEVRGFTTGEIIRKRVVIEAQRLLHYTTLPVNDIADKLGFESPSYFITFFKKLTLTTPELFRKQD